MLQWEQCPLTPWVGPPLIHSQIHSGVQRLFIERLLYVRRCQVQGRNAAAKKTVGAFTLTDTQVSETGVHSLLFGGDGTEMNRQAELPLPHPAWGGGAGFWGLKRSWPDLCHDLQACLKGGMGRRRD